MDETIMPFPKKETDDFSSLWKRYTSLETDDEWYQFLHRFFSNAAVHGETPRNFMHVIPLISIPTVVLVRILETFDLARIFFVECLYFTPDDSRKTLKTNLGDLYTRCVDEYKEKRDSNRETS